MLEPPKPPPGYATVLLGTGRLTIARAINKHWGKSPSNGCGLIPGLWVWPIGAALADDSIVFEKQNKEPQKRIVKTVLSGGVFSL